MLLINICSSIFLTLNRFNKLNLYLLNTSGFKCMSAFNISRYVQLITPFDKGTGQRLHSLSRSRSTTTWSCVKTCFDTYLSTWKINMGREHIPVRSQGPDVVRKDPIHFYLCWTILNTLGLKYEAELCWKQKKNQQTLIEYENVFLPLFNNRVQQGGVCFKISDITSFSNTFITTGVLASKHFSEM